MATGRDKRIIPRPDYVTILIWLALVALGWMSICGASFSYDNPDMLSTSTRSGMQIIWIGTSLAIGFVIMLIDDRLFNSLAYLIYIILMVVLFAAIFNPHEIKGSKSWIVLGPIRLQPAEFAKCATALCLAQMMGKWGFDIRKPANFLKALLLVVLPMALIILEKETGSALVYLAFFIVFYREGMTGSVLVAGVAIVVWFVVGIGYGNETLWDTPTNLGESIVLFMVQMLSSALLYVYSKDIPTAGRSALMALIATLAALLFSEFVIPFNIVWIQLAISVIQIAWFLCKGFVGRIKTYVLVSAFALGSIAFFYSADYVLNNVLEQHQRVRINVLLGLEDDPSGAGYNVNQSEIAIGSGGLKGKGFRHGTQTKLKFVPEQDTDFIFCTVGEEEGFVGSAAVLLLFLALIIRIIYLSERQTTSFGRIYGYSVMSIILFHVVINVGMVLGLAPVIGIPLPFFSYGGSSLWGFTIMLFIFLRIDAGRTKRG